MARTTRSGAQWSPWELDITPEFLNARTPPAVFQSRVSLAPHLAQAIAASDSRAAPDDERADGDDGDEREDEQPCPRAASPSASPSPMALSSGFSRSPSPLSDLPASPEPLPLSTRQRRKKEAKKVCRRRARVAAAQGKFGPPPKARHDQTYRQEESHIAPANAVDLPSSSGGNWIGHRALKKPHLSQGPRRDLQELLEDGHDLVRWNGRGLKLILDAEGRIVAILLGRPEGDDWDEVMLAFRKLMDSRPGTLSHSKAYQKLLDHVLANRAVKRIAGFQSSGLACFVPKLYDHQRAVLKSIYQDQPELQPPFRNSIFPTITCNLGPEVVTDEHLDFLNNPYGMCAITSASNFDHTRGGHIFMKQLKTVCEFPAGSTILLLSGTCEHGNTPIQPGENRYSITQYAAGSLFRWAVYGNQSIKTLLAQVGGAARKEEIDGEPGARATFALGLLSKADEVDADREAIFGRNREDARGIKMDSRESPISPMSLQMTLLFHPSAHVETCRLIWALDDKQRATMAADGEKPEHKKKPKPKLFDSRLFIQGPPSTIIQDGPRKSHQTPSSRVTSPQPQLLKMQPAGDELTVTPWVQQQEAKVVKASWALAHRDCKDEESRACLARVLKENPPHPTLCIIDRRGRRDALSLMSDHMSEKTRRLDIINGHTSFLFTLAMPE
ncbi:hypothetical protein K438DRAFT_1753895 [Mycena galopus ATCC 62051]|nr:hypothetical protein K438DRAFT_1753895 [Mycena galopus ATCC 62051]